jgi:uncharacterized coiled-coil DUF342 family protein
MEEDMSNDTVLIARCGGHTTQKANMPRNSNFQELVEQADDLLDELNDAGDKADEACDRARAHHNALTKFAGVDDLKKVAGLIAEAQEAMAFAKSIQRKVKRAQDQARAARDGHDHAVDFCQPMPVPRGFMRH